MTLKFNNYSYLFQRIRVCPISLVFIESRRKECKKNRKLPVTYLL